MRLGIVYSSSRRPVVYRGLKRQIVAEFKLELDQATGWKRDWIRWKRGIALEMRYNGLLFSEKQSLIIVNVSRFAEQPGYAAKINF